MGFRVLLSPPDVGELEQGYVLRAMKSGWVAPAGPDLDAFETEVASRVGREFAVALSSGTAALHLGLVSWGVGPGDVVPVSTLTFAASVNAIRYVGAEPYFVDSEPESGCINVALLEEAIVRLKRAGRAVPCVIPVDLLGRCADLTAVTEIADQHGVRVLTDAAESLGATHAGVSGAAYGDAAVLSFNGNKIMTTSGGGMLVTDDERLALHVRKLSTQAREPVAHYEHNEVGYNYRLSNILAALGRAQLLRLDGMLQRRRGWRERYGRLVEGREGFRILGGVSDKEDNCWLTALIIDPDVADVTATDLQQRFADSGIESRPLWKPMHLQPANAAFSGILDGTSDMLFRCGLTLPSGSGMSEQEFAAVMDVLAGVDHA